jgi:hypothetical protein
MLTMSDIHSLNVESMILDDLILTEAQLHNLVSSIHEKGRPLPRGLGSKLAEAEDRVNLKIRDMKKHKLAKLQAQYKDLLPNDVKLQNLADEIASLKADLGE